VYPSAYEPRRSWSYAPAPLSPGATPALARSPVGLGGYQVGGFPIFNQYNAGQPGLYGGGYTLPYQPPFQGLGQPFQPQLPLLSPAFRPQMPLLSPPLYSPPSTMYSPTGAYLPSFNTIGGYHPYSAGGFGLY
jgi:hypothetical protein